MDKDLDILGFIIVNGAIPLSIQKQIALNEQVLKNAKEKQESYKEQLTRLMEENGVTSIENDDFKVTYFPENETTRFDSAKVKAEYPEVYIECMKKSKVKSFIKLETK